MISLVFLVFAGLVAWSGIVLLNKGPKSVEIKEILMQITLDLIQAFTGVVKLFNLLKDSRAAEALDENSDPAKGTLNLINIKEK